MCKTWILLDVFALVALGVALLAPFVVRAQLASVLSEQAGHAVSVASVRLAFTSRVITVMGVSGGPDLVVGSVVVDLHIPSLFGREVRVERL